MRKLTFVAAAVLAMTTGYAAAQTMPASVHADEWHDDGCEGHDALHLR